MNNIYKTPAKNLTINDVSNAVDIFNTISKDPECARMFRKIVETCFNPELITLIRDMHQDSEVFCDSIRPFFADSK